ncbi:hypothetical protein KFE98_06445 [bacterium SCSIO 12741]|nr:hypothetical protein KFE98_06445 [bacterium SCSIO 12741]
MTNGFGLLGHSSSSQSAVVVPFVSQPNKYYLFTVPTTPAVGAKYSVVDMALNNGLGDVVLATKNTSLTNFPVSDKMSAVAHANGRDYWLMVQNENTWSLNAYLVSSSGVAATPVVSSTSGGASGSVGHYGCMKFSPNGKFVCAAVGAYQSLYLYSFNASSGAATSLLNVSSLVDYNLIYGVAFSANSKVLYVSTWGQVYQFDLTQTTSTAILASRYTVDTHSVTTGIGAQMQLAPDKKIYMSNLGQTFLSVIDSPNSLGSSCNFSKNGLNLTAGSNCAFGLPNFVQTFLLNPKLLVEDACDGQYVKIALEDTSGLDSVLFNYGDPASGASNYSRQYLDSHKFTTHGKFLVTTYTYSTDNFGVVVTDTLVDSVLVDRIPIVSLPGDTMICIWDSVEARVTQAVKYDLLWKDSSTTHFYTVDTTGSHWVVASNHCGSSTDTIVVDSLFLRTIDLGKDTVVCEGDTLRLTVSDTGATYLWSDSSSLPIFEMDTSGLVWVETVNQCGVKRDSIYVELRRVPDFTLGPDTTICADSNYILGQPLEKGVSYLWDNGWSGVAQVLARTTGIKWLEKSTVCGSHRDSVFILVQQRPKVTLGPDTVMCAGDTFLLHVLDSPATYTWQNGSSNRSFEVTKDGIYWVDLKNACGQVRDSLKVDVLTVPVVQLPSDTVLCQGDSIMVEMPNPQSAYLWSDGSNRHFLRISSPGVYWGGPPTLVETIRINLP